MTILIQELVYVIPEGFGKFHSFRILQNVQNFGLDTINIDSVFDKFKVRLLADNNEYTHD